MPPERILVPILAAVLGFAVVPAVGESLPLPEAINAVDLTSASVSEASKDTPSPAIAKLQILLDRAGASPGVIDGFDGDNFRKAVRAFELMSGLDEDGEVDPALVAKLQTTDPVIVSYTVTESDVSDLVPEIPDDYAEMAKLKFLGFTRVTEALGERFHMDEDLLQSLNPQAAFTAGEEIFVASIGEKKTGKVAKIEADKTDRQVRAYNASGALLVAYPATIGSEGNPSPTGRHLVAGVVAMPDYTYNPDVNFKQGDNDEILTIPPGPNGPVGSTWIDLTEPTFGIHGSPEPSKIDKTNSHGCVRLTNWDAQELAAMVENGVPVVFLD